MNRNRSEHSATLLNNGKVLIVNGSSITTINDQYVYTAELYDPDIGEFFYTKNEMENPRYDHSAVLLCAASSKTGHLPLQNKVGK